jgi:hypothetical protein
MVEQSNGDPAVYASPEIAALVRSVRRKRQVAPWLILALFLLVFIVASVLGALWAGDLSF